MPATRTPPLDWVNLLFLAAVHAAAIGSAVAYFGARAPGPAMWILAAVWTALTILGLSAGYHRLFSHRAYEAHPAVRLFLLAFGAAAFQNSALTWAADHRRHHRHVDSDRDPYDARRGFWHAHIGWVLRQTPPATQLHPAPDLERDRLVAWQHRHYPLLGALVGFVMPAAIGLALGDVWGGLVLGGLVRLVLVYHITFSVNSFAHLVGSQPYSDRDSSRDSPLIALLSMGEGYHNFHHAFPGDYRNGVAAHHFDPSKWVIGLLAVVGLARKLRRTPAPAVARARLRREEARLAARIAAGRGPGLAAALRARLEETLGRWQDLLARRQEALSRGDHAALRRLREEIRTARAFFQRTYRLWRRALRAPDRQPTPGLGAAA